MRWTIVAQIQSKSNPKVKYDISRSDDGRYGCSCTAFQFKKGAKTCKHLLEYTATVAASLKAKYGYGEVFLGAGGLPEKPKPEPVKPEPPVRLKRHIELID